MSGTAAAALRAARRGAPAARRLEAGQPTPATHPELLAPGELAPGVPAAEFAARRARLAARLPPGGLALLAATPQAFMAGVIPYPYRPRADFLYVTGITQPGVVAALSSDGRFQLFTPDADAWREVWDGAALGPEAAVEVFGADAAAPLAQLGERLGAAVGAAPAVAFDAEPGGADPLLGAVPALRAAAAAGRVRSLRPALHALRWTKSPGEAALMRRAAAAAAAAQRACAAASAAPGATEASLAALFEYTCRRAGAQRPAFPPVVAAGADAVTIHYSRNDKLLKKGDMLLLDGGCELHGYCSDVTRTWPVGGRFLSAQRALYEAVLGAHRRLLAAAAPGATLRGLHAASAEALGDAAAALGLLAKAGPGEGLRTFYPHSVGHWLGGDTHDVATVSHDAPLAPGVALTIEPGLYVPNEARFGALRGLGVRIEDDVLITERGSEVLSAGAPIEVEEVEAMARGEWAGGG
jgi:Xaa-Pro aminopeptidase